MRPLEAALFNELARRTNSAPLAQWPIRVEQPVKPKPAQK